MPASFGALCFRRLWGSELLSWARSQRGACTSSSPGRAHPLEGKSVWGVARLRARLEALRGRCFVGFLLPPSPTPPPPQLRLLQNSVFAARAQSTATVQGENLVLGPQEVLGELVEPSGCLVSSSPQHLLLPPLKRRHWAGPGASLEGKESCRAAWS